MGSLIQATCGCGYASEVIAQGGGFRDFTEVDMEPAYCRHCRDLVVCNHREPGRRCPRCGGKVRFYNSPSLWKNPDGQNRGGGDLRWGRFRLPDAEYLCPRCGEMKMKFHLVGTWD